MSHVNNDNVTLEGFEGGLRFDSRRISLPRVSAGEACHKVSSSDGSKATVHAISQAAIVK
jgi:hypothetical protein